MGNALTKKVVKADKALFRLIHCSNLHPHSF